MKKFGDLLEGIFDEPVNAWGDKIDDFIGWMRLAAQHKFKEAATKIRINRWVEDEGKRIFTMIKKPSKELREKYAAIDNLKKTGMFR